MNRFSVTFLDKKARLYTCNKEVYNNLFLKYKSFCTSDDILCQTMMGDEITFYVYEKMGDITNSINHHIFQKICTVDPRSYLIINIHEDVPGIDHIGIIHHISGYFLKKQIPILYINTYGYNLVLVSDEYLSQVQNIFNEIAYIS
jgi:hypothetical protein